MFEVSMLLINKSTLIINSFLSFYTKEIYNCLVYTWHDLSRVKKKIKTKIAYGNEKGSSLFILINKVFF